MLEDARPVDHEDANEIPRTERDPDFPTELADADPEPPEEERP